MFKWSLRCITLGTGILGGVYWSNKNSWPVFDHVFEDHEREGFVKFKRNLDNKSISFV